ncbi:hypothetical protein [Rhodococcus sp. NCIMB 12038]|uniref:hypothetical protein n=1 Tax=Rhodococcus sp. NCIMB 12038 TaxID=933800 RepID=UPI00117A74AD|nr:hypothetical protein [Rhodococcus sp. NCIMB 12038]
MAVSSNDQSLHRDHAGVRHRADLVVVVPAVVGILAGGVFTSLMVWPVLNPEDWTATGWAAVGAWFAGFATVGAVLVALRQSRRAREDAERALKRQQADQLSDLLADLQGGQSLLQPRCLGATSSARTYRDEFANGGSTPESRGLNAQAWSELHDHLGRMHSVAARFYRHAQDEPQRLLVTDAVEQAAMAMYVARDVERTIISNRELSLDDVDWFDGRIESQFNIIGEVVRDFDAVRIGLLRS